MIPIYYASIRKQQAMPLPQANPRTTEVVISLYEVFVSRRDAGLYEQHLVNRLTTTQQVKPKKVLQSNLWHSLFLPAQNSRNRKNWRRFSTLRKTTRNQRYQTARCDLCIHKCIHFLSPTAPLACFQIGGDAITRGYAT